jgi:enoyl-CoA hydratase
LDSALASVVETLLKHAPLTMWAAKVAVARLRRANLPDGDDFVTRVFGSEDFRRAVASFGASGAGKRQPWTGT